MHVFLNLLNKNMLICFNRDFLSINVYKYIKKVNVIVIQCTHVYMKYQHIVFQTMFNSSNASEGGFPMELGFMFILDRYAEAIPHHGPFWGGLIHS